MKELKMELGDGDAKVVSISLFRANQEERRIRNGTTISGFGKSEKPKPRCGHLRVEVDTTLAELLCLECNEKVNPIEWIANLVEHWHFIQNAIQHWHDAHTRAKAVESAVDLKSRTKCQHCQKLTKIRISSTEAKDAQLHEEMRAALATIGRLKGIGHETSCSASQGSEGDCTCGSWKVRQLISRLRWQK